MLVGHVTKEGELAGPRVLEHAVDTVLSFSGDRHHALRLLRAVKHRFGSTDELGLFEMGERGLAGVPDPSALFLADRRSGVPGSVVVPTLDGNRPLLVEVQALVSTAGPQGARRSAQGIDPGRLALLIAVLEQRVGLSLVGLDVYVSVAGGVRITEPGSDLAIALAIASALTGHALPSDLVALGEIGLAGELRQVAQTPRRVSEARRLGFDQLVVPESAPDVAGRHVPPRADARDGARPRRPRTRRGIRGGAMVSVFAQVRSRRGTSSQPRPGPSPPSCRAWHCAARRPRPRPQSEDGRADHRR